MVRTTPETDEERYVSQNDTLRKVYLFAEALGGYEALNDLSSKYSPRNILSQRCRKKAKVAVLEPHEVQIVEDYHRQLGDSLKSANR